MNTELIDKKVEYWENHLLHLGKRNKMISFGETIRFTIKTKKGIKLWIR